ncbi:unnamed protein product [Adineta steineri]|uniref:C2 domain-containing protein n=1 Tax=Adineta steineri TaxID=433720 RepID=A0A814X7U3_9BILA|nr:unnamed protein product [Adineta steineri]
MVQGHLHVTIVEAAKLADKDQHTFNDSYVEVYLAEDDKQKTKTIKNNERPVWDETFDFELPSTHQHIHIEVYDEDEDKKGKSIGSTQISLDKVIKTGHYDDWVQLSTLFGFSSQGDVHIRMTFEKVSDD